MELLNLIEKRVEKIKKNNNINIILLEMKENNKLCDFSNVENKLEYKIDSELKKIYLKYEKIRLNWEIKETRERGCFDLIELKSLYMKTKELLDIAEEYKNFDRIENIKTIIDDIKNWIPLFKFPNGDYFCIDKRNNKIVFYEHDVFDSGPNLHGLIISESIYDLIQIWSKVSYIDIYDWYEGVNYKGIDINKKIYKNIIELN